MYDVFTEGFDRWSAWVQDRELILFVVAAGLLFALLTLRALRRLARRRTNTRQGAMVPDPVFDVSATLASLEADPDPVPGPAEHSIVTTTWRPSWLRRGNAPWTDGDAADRAAFNDKTINERPKVNASPAVASFDDATVASSSEFRLRLLEERRESWRRKIHPRAVSRSTRSN